MPIPNYWNGCGSGCYPPYGPNAITSPPVYDESVSIVQQVAYLFGYIKSLGDTLSGYLTADEFNAFLDSLKIEQAEQTAEAHKYADDRDAELRRDLVKMINEMVVAETIWNPTSGAYGNSVDATRDMMRWLAVRALTVGQLADLLSVEELAATKLNVRGLATWSVYLDPAWTEPANIRVM